MSEFQILLDVPSPRPALGFRPMAIAFAQLIERSQPRFAIGVFGGWGSGKTTLMQSIRSELNREDTLKVFFNAWRYEREPHLMVPLLDAVRGAIVEWSEGRDETVKSRTLEIARTIGRVVAALAAGLSAEVSVPGFAKLTYKVPDGARIADTVREADSSKPQSLYFACFEQLDSAFERLRAEGVQRIVVFVDDLDRCLPHNALDVLESMKLFFDLPGFVFVVGIDQLVLERAVRSRIAGVLGNDPAERSALGERRTRIAEREYVKKIFQLPYELAPVGAEQLDELLESICASAELSEQQLSELWQRARGYLAHVAVDGQLNPREVKRFVNAYTVQLLVRPALDRDTILAVQTLAFRDDWPMYGMLREDSAAVAIAVARYRTGENGAIAELFQAYPALPPDLVRFLRSDAAAPLERDDLRAYVTSVEATVPTERWVASAYTAIATLRRVIGGVPVLVDQGEGRPAFERAGRAITAAADDLALLVGEVVGSERMVAGLEELRPAVSRLMMGGMNAEQAKAWRGDADQVVDRVHLELRYLRNLALAEGLGRSAGRPLLMKSRPIGRAGED